MDLQTFLARHPLTDEVPPDRLAALQALLEQGVGLIDLLRRPELGVPVRTVREVVAAWGRLSDWQQRSAPLRGKVPVALLERAVEPHQLQALERALPITGIDRLHVALDLWDRCVALARKDGGVTAQGAPGRGFDEYLRRREPLDRLAPHRWLRMRRGERERALVLRFDLPTQAFGEQAELLDVPDTLLEPLVLRPLDTALREIMDRWAEEEAIRAAQSLYVSLLTTPPLEAAPALAVAVGRQPGVAVIDAKGELVAGRVVADLREAASIADQHQVKAIVLPTRAPEMDLLQKARDQLGKGRTVAQVSPAGLSEAREGISQPKPVASAIVLGRRAIRPMIEWSRIDPVRLGLAEYQTDLDEERLRRALEEAREGAQLERQTIAAPRAATMRLGPGVKSIDELKPGTIVTGVVTSLTPFGAFVNLGPEQEGLVHVSEIADRFVKDPAEVVQIGQTVLAKVLSVDQARGRVSLSLRREDKPRPKAEAANARSKALSALDQLFKK